MRNLSWCVVALLAAGCAEPVAKTTTPVAPAAAPAAERPEGEWARDSDALFPGNIPLGAEGSYRYAVIKVVDAQTGAPIAGARVSTTSELPYPIPTVPFRGHETDVTGPDGWGRVSLEHVPGLSTTVYVEADGYAAQKCDAAGGSMVELERPIDLAFEVRDRRERPVAGATIDWHLGCGHTPAVALSRTGADGRALLRGVPADEGTGYMAGPGVEGEYVDGVDWQPGEPPIVLRHGFALPLEGRVVNADGTPAAGICVGAPELHRGPWTRTDATGRYRLVGLSHRSLSAGRDPYADAHDLELEAAPPGFETLIRMPREGTRQWGWEERSGTRVRFLPTDGDGTPIRGCSVTVIDPRDGWSQTVRAGDPNFDDKDEFDPARKPHWPFPELQGPTYAEFALPPGDYVVRLDDWTQEWARDEFRLTVGDTPVDRPIAPRRNGHVRLALEGGAEEASLSLLTDESEELLNSPDASAPERVPVPFGRPAWIRAALDGFVTLTPVPAIAPGEEQTVAIRWEEPKTVRVRLVDGTGAPAPGMAELRTASGASEEADGTELEFRTRGHGAAVCILRHRDGDWAQRRRVVFDLPGAPGAVVDLGAVQVEQAPEETDTPDERPCTLAIRVAGSDGEGLPPDALVTLTLTIDGDGDERWNDALAKGSASARLGAGAHEVVVATMGYLARVHRVVLQPGESRELTVTLTRR